MMASAQSSATGLGSPSSHVAVITQDSIGYIWIGSPTGLFRYDGFHTSHFSTDTQAFKLSDNWVYAIYPEPKASVVWVGTSSGGLNRLDFELGTTDYFLTGYSLFHIIPRDKQLLWLGTNRGLLLFDKMSHKIVSSWPNIRARQAIVVGNSLFIGSGKGLYKLIGTELQIVLELATQTLAFDGRHLWAATGDGLARIDPDKIQNVTWFKAYNSVRVLKPSRTANHLWIGDSSGKLSLLNTLTYQPVPSALLPSKSFSITALHEDTSGGLWVGSVGGLERLEQSKISHHSDNQEYFSADLLLTTDKEENGIGDDVWLLSKKQGIAKLNLVTNALKIPQWGNKEIRGKHPTALLKKGDYLWIGTFKGLYRINLHNGESKAYTHNPDDPTSLSDNIILSITEGHHQQIMVGTDSGGLNILDDPQNDHFYHINKEQHHLASGEVLTAIPLSNNRTGIGTSHGLSIFDNFTRKVINLDGPDNNMIKVNSLIEIGQHLFVGTFGYGLFDIESNQSNQIIQISHFSTKNGLSSNFVMDLLLGDGGRLWIGTFEGIDHFDLQTQRFTPLFIKRTTTSFPTNVLLPLANGRIVASGLGGVISWRAADFYAKNNGLPVVITSAKTSDNELFAVKDIHLNYHSTALEVVFSVLDFSEAAQYSYSYLLEGMNQNWNLLGKTNTLSIPGLSPGKYKLRIRSHGGDGLPRPSEAVLDIFVAPPAWLSPWAYVFYSLILAAGLIFIIRKQYFRVKGLRNSLAQEAEFSKQLRTVSENLLEVREDQHRELAIHIYREITQNLMAIKLITLDKMPTVQRLVNNMNHSLRKIVTDLDSRVLSKQGLQSAIREFTLEFKKEHNMECHLQLKFDLIDLAEDKAIAIFRIFEKALSNIAKQGSASRIEVSMEIIENHFDLMIRDNSLSNNTLFNKFGYALLYMRERAHAFGGEIKVEQDSGTYITLSMPIADDG